jgi:hypothetical protein
MTTDDRLARLRSVLPVNTWTPIATRPRYNIDEPAPWSPVEGAVLSIDTANELMMQGLLLKALKYTPDRLFVVVMPRKEVAPPPPPPRSAADPITNWPDDRLARLVELWREADDEGPLHSISEIGEILGCPAESVRHKAKSLGWSTRGRRERMAA